MNLLEHYSRSRIFSSEELYTWRTYLQEEFTIKGDKRITNREDCKYETLSTVFHFRISGLIKVSLLDHFLLLVFTAFSSHFPLLCYHLALSSRFLLLVFTFQLTFFFFFLDSLSSCVHTLSVFPRIYFVFKWFVFRWTSMNFAFMSGSKYIVVIYQVSFFSFFSITSINNKKFTFFLFFFSPSNAIPIVKKKKKCKLFIWFLSFIPYFNLIHNLSIY